MTTDPPPSNRDPAIRLIPLLGEASWFVVQTAGRRLQWSRRPLLAGLSLVVGPLLGLGVLFLGRSGEPPYPDPSPRLWDCVGVEATAGMVAATCLALSVAFLDNSQRPEKPPIDDLADF